CHRRDNTDGNRIRIFSTEIVGSNRRQRITAGRQVVGGGSKRRCDDVGKNGGADEELHVGDRAVVGGGGLDGHVRRRGKDGAVGRVRDGNGRRLVGSDHGDRGHHAEAGVDRAFVGIIAGDGESIGKRAAAHGG